MNDEPLNDKLARLRAATESMAPRADFAARLDASLSSRSRWSTMASAGRRFTVGAIAIAALAIGFAEVFDRSSLDDLDSSISYGLDVEAPW